MQLEPSRRKFLQGLASTAALTALPAAYADAPGKRVALVIGIDQYDALPTLKNAVADAETVANMLKDNGFNVHLHRNVKNRAQLENMIVDLVQACKNTRGEALWFYYGGHGFSDAQETYLAPSNAPLPSQGASSTPTIMASLSLGWALSELGQVDFIHRFAVFDACREDLNRGMVSTSDQPLPLAPPRIQTLHEQLNFSLVMTSAPGGVVSDGAFVSTFVDKLTAPGVTWSDAIAKSRQVLGARVALKDLKSSSFVLKPAPPQSPFANGGSALWTSASFVAVALALAYWWTRKPAGHIEIVDANTGERLLRLSPGSKELLGRRTTGLLADTAVSNQHAYVGVDHQGRFWLEDISSGGTYSAASVEAKLEPKKVHYFPLGQVLYLAHQGVAIRVQACQVASKKPVPA